VTTFVGGEEGRIPEGLVGTKRREKTSVAILYYLRTEEIPHVLFYPLSSKIFRALNNRFCKGQRSELKNGRQKVVARKIVFCRLLPKGK
jgi:hypothetical protein